MNEKNAVMIVLVLTGMVVLFSVVIISIYRIFLSQLDKRTLRYQRDLLEKHCQEVENM